MNHEDRAELGSRSDRPGDVSTDKASRGFDVLLITSLHRKEAIVLQI